jgi:phosphate:Na+ symporter
MSTTIAVLGGVGLFLLGMTVMTDGLKAMAGSKLRVVLGKASATPLMGVFWGAIVTLLVQSSSATTMTTIGLVSAGLLTFPQGLGLVFGANIGTTGTGWLVALIGVRVSLTAFALPMIFAGALLKLLGRGRASAAGAALAGFALVLFGLTTLQEGMGGLAQALHPEDLPAVMATAASGWLSAFLGMMILVVVGLVMTTVMQSSTAAIAVTLSAYYAGAVGLDQACALIIGQNIGTATSSAMAAIGASITAKRLAIAYILFKLIAALIALVLFPVTTALILRASGVVDGVTLLAAYHTAYNVVGVFVLLPIIGPFTRLVERLLPERGSPLTRCLDRAALATPVAAVEATRRTIARALKSICDCVERELAGASHGKAAGPAKGVPSLAEAAEALRQAQVFLSDVSGPPESDDEQQRLTSTLHALDHASRLAEIASSETGPGPVNAGPDGKQAAALCLAAIRSAAAIATDIAPLQDIGQSESGHPDKPDDTAFAELERSAAELSTLQATHRETTLRDVGNGSLTAHDAILGVEAVRRLASVSHHAWRCAAHLADRAR